MTLEDFGKPVEGQVDAVVRHPPLWEIIGADALGAVAGADHRFPRPRPLARQPLALQLVKAGAQHLQRLGLVLVLRLLVLLDDDHAGGKRSEEHTSELQSLMRISYAVFCLYKKNILT